jgi:tetratricopeptide (TPR) repeat protein
MKRPALMLALLGVATFSVGAWLQPRLVRADKQNESDSVMKILFGEGRRMFANHFAIKADVYMHSGYYPSIFDQAAAAAKAEEAELAKPVAQSACAAGCTHDHDHDHKAEAALADEHEHEDGDGCARDFLGQSRDWIEAFGRNFIITEHAHLEGGKEREMLPWLRIAAELDPQRVETYIVAAYWLGERLNKTAEAEQFLRQGLKANPHSYELLTELGKVCRKLNEPDRARNIWRLALRRWDETEKNKKEPDTVGRHGLLLRLADLEESQGHLNEAVRWLQEAKAFSQNPAVLDERIGDIWLKVSPPAVEKPTPLL